MPTKFFHANGIAKFFPSTAQLEAGPATVHDAPVTAAGKNNRRHVEERFGRCITQKMQHVPYALQKSVLEEIEAQLPDEVLGDRRPPVPASRATCPSRPRCSTTGPTSPSGPCPARSGTRTPIWRTRPRPSNWPSCWPDAALRRLLPQRHRLGGGGAGRAGRHAAGLPAAVLPVPFTVRAALTTSPPNVPGPRRLSWRRPHCRRPPIARRFPGNASLATRVPCMPDAESTGDGTVLETAGGTAGSARSAYRARPCRAHPARGPTAEPDRGGAALTAAGVEFFTVRGLDDRAPVIGVRGDHRAAALIALRELAARTAGVRRRRGAQTRRPRSPRRAGRRGGLAQVRREGNPPGLVPDRPRPCADLRPRVRVRHRVLGHRPGRRPHLGTAPEPGHPDVAARR